MILGFLYILILTGFFILTGTKLQAFGDSHRHHANI